MAFYVSDVRPANRMERLIAESNPWVDYEQWRKQLNAVWGKRLW